MCKGYYLPNKRVQKHFTVADASMGLLPKTGSIAYY